MILNRNSPKYRELLWKACVNESADGKVRCNLCGMEVISGDDWEPWKGEDWHESHIGIPKAHGGFTVGIAHKRCNERDNNEFVTPFVAKGKRMWRNHHGVTGPGLGPKPMRGGRHSSETKTFNNGVQPRLSGPEKYAQLMQKLYPWGMPE